MKKLALLSFLGPLLFSIAVYADTPYFYGGDFDPGNQNADAQLNDNVGDYFPYLSATYQNFYAQSSLTVRGLFTNNLSDFTPSVAYWEVRSGVTEGNGGTLISAGVGVVANDPTGRQFKGYDEYTNLVSGLGVNLVPGQYWFAVVPVCESCDPNRAAYNTNTFGLNSIGKSDLNLEYYNSPAFGVNFLNANTGTDHFPTFSSGVYADPGIPEPGSLLLMGTGVAGVAGVLRRRLFQTPR